MQRRRKPATGPNVHFWAWLGILVALFLALGLPTWIYWVAFLYLLAFPFLFFWH